MSKLDSFIQEKEQRNENWKAQKEAEREEMKLMSDDAILTATKVPEAYLRYLDVQADHPQYSATNILLVLSQNSEVTQVNSMERWNELGRSVRREESGLKIRISEPYMKDGQEYRGYKIGRVFDVSQTTGKGRLREKTVLEENSPQMDTALRKLLEMSPVKIVTNAAMRSDAFYEPKAQEISVSSRLTDGQTFAALAREIVHAKIHNHGKYPHYSREDSKLDADSVSYMLCRSFGISRDKPDAAHIFNLNDGMETKDRRSMLDMLQQIFRGMQKELQKEVSPREKQAEQQRQVR